MFGTDLIRAARSTTTIGKATKQPIEIETEPHKIML
jgi:hypothetical protein